MNSLSTKGKDIRNLVYQAAHDMRSPIVALQLMIRSCNELQEDKLTILRSLASRMYGITNSLLNDYKNEKCGQSCCEQRQVMSCADFVDQLINEKKYEYQNYPELFIKQIVSYQEEATIFANPIQLGRSLSNLINNAVDALSDKAKGRITISLVSSDVHVTITIQDDGVGMPESALNKINQRIGFTDGKADGHGLGLTQVWEMLDDNDGKMAVQSTQGQGTQIVLTFPKYVHE